MRINFGHGSVFVRSEKHRIVTKSSIEEELVALSYIASLLFHIEYFIAGQDNKSTIAMLTTVTKESMRTRHINVRYYWLRKRIKNQELTLVHVPFGDMLADIINSDIQHKHDIHTGEQENCKILDRLTSLDQLLCGNWRALERVLFRYNCTCCLLLSPGQSNRNRFKDIKKTEQFEKDRCYKGERRMNKLYITLPKL